MATITRTLKVLTFSDGTGDPHPFASVWSVNAPSIGDPIDGTTVAVDAACTGVLGGTGNSDLSFTAGMGIDDLPPDGTYPFRVDGGTCHLDVTGSGTTSGPMSALINAQANIPGGAVAHSDSAPPPADITGTYDDAFSGPVNWTDASLFVYIGEILAHAALGSASTFSGSVTFNSLTIDLDFTTDVVSITPDTAAPGASVTIVGHNFMPGATVEFGSGNFASGVVVVDYQHITCDVPSGSGLVDIIVTNTSDFDNASGTLTDGFTFIDSVGPPTIDMGPDQFVLGPPTRTLTASATVTDGTNTAGSTYLWEFVDGPYEPTFGPDPTALSIDVAFDHYDPGTFTFRLTATGIPLDSGVALVSTAEMHFIIKETVAPHISTGTVVVEYPDCATINPVVTDDGWGGAVGLPTYEFVSGPTTPTVTISGFFDPSIYDPNIFDCYSVKICGFIDETAVYVFRVTFTREDSLSSSVLWRIVVISDVNPEADLNDGPVSLSVNGVEFEAQLMSTSISKNLNSIPTCNFKLYNSRIDVGNEVIITRGGVRLFGGLCQSQTVTFDDETIPFYTPNLVGFAWHLHRTRVTKTYLNQSISAIVADLLTFSPREITGDGIQAGLENASIAFSGDFIDEALTKLGKVSNPPCHWFVDDFGDLHFAKVEPDNDPLPLTDFHPYFKALSLTEDISNMANRVVVNYNAVSTVPVEVDRDIEVDSLDGYNPSGGKTRIGANDITYSGTVTRKITNFRGIYPNIQVTIVSSPGSPGDWSNAYGLTYSTPYGETAIVWGSGNSGSIGVDNGVKLKLVQQLVGPDQFTDPNQISAINVYRGFEGDIIFVGTMSPKGGPGLTDGNIADDLPLPVLAPYDQDQGEKVGFFLTGCNGTSTTNVVSTVTEDDTFAQAELATRLGGTDSGIIEVVLDGGDITEDAARQLALAYLDRVKVLRKSANYTVRDDKTIPGQTATIVFPDLDFEESLTIQSATLQGFEKGVFHEYNVTASPDEVRLEDLLKHTTDLLPKKS